MNEYAAGNIIRLPVYFASRALTPVEEQTFQTAGTLPAGVGVDQQTVKIDYWRENDAPTVGIATVHDGPGLYHADVTITTPGIWNWSGYSVDGSSNPVARMLPRQFRVRTAAGPGEPVP